MKRLLFFVMLAACFALGAHRADATTCTVPNSFTNGTAADANQVNANFSSLQACGNNIDHNNIGSAGIYATQIIPTTVGQAIFGGGVVYQFSNGLIVNGGLTLGTALSIANGGTNAISFTSGALLYFDGTEFNSATVSSPLSFSAGSLTLGAIGQSNVTNGYVDKSTAQSIGGAKSFSVGITAGIDANDISYKTSAADGYLSLQDGSSSGGFRVINFADTLDNIIAPDSGGLETRASGQSTNTYVPPVYTSAGAAAASTLHLVNDTVTASGNTTTITLSGAAVYSSATAFSCVVMGIAGGGAGAIAGATPNTASSFTFNSVTGVQYRYLCAGT